MRFSVDDNSPEAKFDGMSINKSSGQRSTRYSFDHRHLSATSAVDKDLQIPGKDRGAIATARTGEWMVASNSGNVLTLFGLNLPASGPPKLKPANVAGDWSGPNGEAFKLKQNGHEVIVSENNKTIATIQISGNTITWGTAKGTVKEGNIEWSNNTIWKRKGGGVTANTTPVSGPPAQKFSNVSGQWTGSNGKSYQLQQKGKDVTIREGNKTLATVSIQGHTITWGITNGKITGNRIRWDNNTTWKRKADGATTRGSNG